MKKLLIITYYWEPSGGPGVQRTLKLVKYLRNFNVEPIIITVDERYASYQLKDYTLKNDLPDDVKVFRTKSLEPFNIYKKVNRTKEIPYSGFANESNPTFMQKISRFIRGNFFIPDARRGWNRYAYKEACRIIEMENPDAVLISTPPHSTQLIGLKLKKRYKIPLIVDLRDPWTDIFYYDKFYHTKNSLALDKKYERQVLENADFVITVSEHLKDLFLSKLNVKDENKFVVIPNGYDEDDFKDVTCYIPDIFTITYTGTISDDYDIDGFIASIKQFVNMFKGQLKLRFMGKVSPLQMKKFINSELNEITEFIPYGKHNESISLMCNSSALLLVIPKTNDNAGIVTGKLFEYMASGKPIIGIGPVNGEAAKIISDCNCGNMFDYNDSKGLLKYITDLLTVNDHYSLEPKYVCYSRKAAAESVAKILDKSVDK